MKRFSRLTIILIMAIAVLLASTTAFAAGTFKKDIPATVNIKANNPGLTFYTDSYATTEVTSLNFGDLLQGGTTTYSLYVKNTGNLPFTDVDFVSGMLAEYGTATINIDNYPLTKNGGQPVIITLNIDQNAPVGDNYVPFLHFNCSY